VSRELAELLFSRTDQDLVLLKACSGVISFFKVTEDREGLKPNVVRIFNTERYDVEINNRVEPIVAVESPIYTDIKITFAGVFVRFGR
jgi:hypothetical protein